MTVRRRRALMSWSPGEGEKLNSTCVSLSLSLSVEGLDTVVRVGENSNFLRSRAWIKLGQRTDEMSDLE